MRHRSQQATLRSELLARAIGIKPCHHPKIVDATAGLGRDSFILASLGYRIIMLERSRIIYPLLEKALADAKLKMTEVISRLVLIHTDAISWLKNTAHDRPDVIYLDPMFPERKKSASVKKEMAILQELLGKEHDHVILFQTALLTAKKRVVVKRPRLSANIGEIAPNFTLNGKSSRFDVYLI